MCVPNFATHIPTRHLIPLRVNTITAEIRKLSIDACSNTKYNHNSNHVVAQRKITERKMHVRDYRSFFNKKKNDCSLLGYCRIVCNCFNILFVSFVGNARTKASRLFHCFTHTKTIWFNSKKQQVRSYEVML